jgi:hypothetical protein
LTWVPQTPRLAITAKTLTTLEGPLKLTPVHGGKSLSIRLDLPESGSISLMLSSADAVDLMRSLQALQKKYRWPIPMKRLPKFED